MARVELAQTAVEDLERLIYTHSLPADTKERVNRSLRPLKDFPHIGAALHDRWQEFRFLLGPWRWMLIVYEYFEDDDRVVVVTIQDGRSSRAATAAR
jgi:plasmid stabilization system protein ParE